MTKETEPLASFQYNHRAGQAKQFKASWVSITRNDCGHIPPITGPIVDYHTNNNLIITLCSGCLSFSVKWS